MIRSKRLRLPVICLAVASITGCTAISDMQQKKGLASVTGPEFGAYNGLKRTIAVMEFEDKTPLGRGKVGSAISDMILGVLVRSGRFIVVERTQLDRVLKEQGLSQSGIITGESVVEVGRMLGAHALVMGRLNDLKFGSGRHDFDTDKKKKEGFTLAASVGTAKVSFRVVDTQTGEIILTDDFTERDIRPGFGIRAKDWSFEDIEKFNQSVVGVATRKCANRAAKIVVDGVAKLPWTGKVLKMAGSIAYITPGRSAGVRMDQDFDVFLRHPVEGEEDILVGTIRVFDFVGERVAKAQTIEGEGVRPGCIIRPATTP